MDWANGRNTGLSRLERSGQRVGHTWRTGGRGRRGRLHHTGRNTGLGGLGRTRADWSRRGGLADGADYGIVDGAD